MKEQNKRPSKQNASQKNQQQNNNKKDQDKISLASPAVSRGAAIRAQKRALDDATRAVSQYLPANIALANQEGRRANVITDNFDKLKITFLGGQEEIGEKNMQVIEWKNSAIIIDCGNWLGIELPGVNYSVNDTTYLEGIKNKIKAYVISHGHLDHLGGLKHIVPKYPAPIYGSNFTIGVILKQFEEMPMDGDQLFRPQTVVMNMDNHERLKIGEFFIELVRVTHSVPESSVIVVDTPVGRVINTGDWRLDPEPLDDKPTDVERLKQLGKEGVLLLMSDSTNTQLPGRTPTEDTLQDSFHDVINHAEGRVFVAIFSSNMNRVQMIVNAAVAAGRKVALDGRSMMNYAEIAIRQGILKIPKGTVASMREVAGLPDNKILIICTGGQGEPNAALQRMAEGNHSHITLKPGDSVIVSSTPIPGNEVRYQTIGNELDERGLHLYRHPTHEVDGCGPLHVSGHARREEYREILHIIKPKYFVPIYAGHLNRRYYQDMAIEEGWPRKNVFLVPNGGSLLLTDHTCEPGPDEPHGNLLVDQTGAIVSNVVIKDRLMMSQDGLVTVVLTVDKKTNTSATSPDIISRGFIYMRDNEQLMMDLRNELKRAVAQRFKRVDLDRFKQEIKDHVTHFLYDRTQRSPIVIPVVNVVGAGGGGGKSKGAEKPEVDPQTEAAEQAKRFAQMRAQLLGQDPRVD